MNRTLGSRVISRAAPRRRGGPEGLGAAQVAVLAVGIDCSGGLAVRIASRRAGVSGRRVMLVLVMTEVLLRDGLLVRAIGGSRRLRELQRQHRQQKDEDPATHDGQFSEPRRNRRPSTGTPGPMAPVSLHQYEIRVGPKRRNGGAAGVSSRAMFLSRLPGRIKPRCLDSN